MQREETHEPICLFHSTFPDHTPFPSFLQLASSLAHKRCNYSSRHHFEMVCRVIRTWGWDSFASADKPEWQDIVAREKKDQEPQPQQEEKEKEKSRRRSARGKGRKKKVVAVEKVYKFESDIVLLELPGEILDLVLGEESLSLRDHLALAATCRSLRACYYTLSPTNDPNATSNSRHSILWSGLLKIRPMPEQAIRYFSYSSSTPEERFSVLHIWTNSPFDQNDEEDLGEMQIVRVLPKNCNLTKKGKPRKRKKRKEVGDDPEGDLGIKSIQWLEAIEVVNYYRMTRTQAQSVYKLKGDELTDYLYAFCKPNPYGKHNAPPMHCYLESSVESLAFRLHGGAFKHDELVERREAIAAKKQATRERNGTTGAGKRRKVNNGGYTYYGCG